MRLYESLFSAVILKSTEKDLEGSGVTPTSGFSYKNVIFSVACGIWIQYFRYSAQSDFKSGVGRILNQSNPDLVERRPIGTQKTHSRPTSVHHQTVCTNPRLAAVC